MPSRVRSIDLDALYLLSPPALLSGVDYPLVAKGRRVEQLAAITLPATAVGYVGLRIGSDGDAVRLNMQGQVINLAGEDAVGGVWLVWMGTPSAYASGVVEFAIAGGDGATP